MTRGLEGFCARKPVHELSDICHGLAAFEHSRTDATDLVFAMIFSLIRKTKRTCL